MQNLIKFLISTIHIFLFVLLSGICIFFIYNSSAYKQWALNAFSKEIGAPLFAVQSSINKYLHLSYDNKLLIEQNKYLLNKLANQNIGSSQADSSELADSLMFSYYSAKVLENTINKQNNVMILNKGSRSGINADMGVISPLGIVGVIKDVSPNFSIAISLLNSKFSISAKTSRTGNTGVLEWNGKNYKYAQLGNITNIEDIQIGDTIVTQYSLLFPSDYPIGVISGGLSNNAIGGYYTLQVRLLTNFEKLDHVYVVKNNFNDEIHDMIERSNNE
ncbi:MAG: rod shape-determining protein MreC [Bacteroidales bacterium]|nr:rod shape-determining protein MreC [Bacteroidales bacterium]